VAAPRDEWIEIPVPALIDPAMFEAARGQRDENRSRRRDGEPSQRWLLQALTVCQRCGHAYYVKKAPRSRTYDPANALLIALALLLTRRSARLAGQET